MLRAAEIETHLVVSKAGHLTRSYETELARGDLEPLADVVYSPTNSEPRSPAARFARWG